MTDDQEKPEQEDTNFRIERVETPEPGFVLTLANAKGIANAFVPDGMMVEIMFYVTKHLPGAVAAIAPVQEKASLN